MKELGFHLSLMTPKAAIYDKYGKKYSTLLAD